MSTIFYQKVAECSKNGNLKIHDKEELDAYLNSLYKHPKTTEKMDELLAVGKACLDEGNESSALKIYRHAYYFLSPLECSKERKLEYAQTVLYAFSCLNSSESEYIWECTGEFIHACRDFINTLSPGSVI